MKKTCSVILCLAFLLAAYTGCALRPGKQSTKPTLVYTVDTKPAGPMLYPLHSKAVLDNPYGTEDYISTNYTTNLFRLVNEKWEDITGWINGRYEYIAVNGAVYGIQIYEYGGKIYALGLDGKPIAGFDGLIWQSPWHHKANPPRDLMIVTSTKAYKTAGGMDWGMWPDTGVFNTRTGKLVIPVEYTQLLLMEDFALGFKDGKMTKLDYSGNVLSAQGEDWSAADSGYHGGDDWLLANETTYIDTDGRIVLALRGLRGASNFNGAYAAGWLGGPDDDYDTAVFFDRQGRVAMEKPFGMIQRLGDYYLIDSKEVLDSALQTVFKLEGGDSDGIQEIIDDYIIVSSYDYENETSKTTVYGFDGKALFSVGNGYLMYENGFFHRWDNGMYSLYRLDGKEIFAGARILKISGDGKFIYVDNGKHMGYIDPAGNWVYRVNAAYYNLED